MIFKSLSAYTYSPKTFKRLDDLATSAYNRRTDTDNTLYATAGGATVGERNNTETVKDPLSYFDLTANLIEESTGLSKETIKDPLLKFYTETFRRGIGSLEDVYTSLDLRGQETQAHRQSAYEYGGLARSRGANVGEVQAVQANKMAEFDADRDMSYGKMFGSLAFGVASTAIQYGVDTLARETYEGKLANRSEERRVGKECR